MAFSSVRSSTLLGVQGKAVDVEIHVGMGLPGFTIVGQPDEACRESRDRVRAALLSCDLPWPNRRITVNLATSVHERKGGAGLDVAIAIGLLIVQDILPNEIAERYAFIAELGLDGTLRPVAGVVPLVAAIGIEAEKTIHIHLQCMQECSGGRTALSQAPPPPIFKSLLYDTQQGAFV
jgi:magnesium chelatase family protein